MNDRVTNRADDVHEKRRRRSDSYMGNDLRLEVPEHLKDPDYAYRWINDDKGRLAARTKQDDWDFVDDIDIATDDDDKNKNETTGRIRREVGVTASGKPLFAYLCKKKKIYVEEDFNKEMGALKEKHRALIKNQDSGIKGGIVAEDPKHAYLPAEIRAAVGVTEAKIRRVNPRGS